MYGSTSWTKGVRAAATELQQSCNRAATELHYTFMFGSTSWTGIRLKQHFCCRRPRKEAMTAVAAEALEEEEEEEEVETETVTGSARLLGTVTVSAS